MTIKNTESYRDEYGQEHIVCKGKLCFMAPTEGGGYKKPIILSEIETTAHPEGNKVLVRPEQFSPKSLQNIASGKLKEGHEVFVKCGFLSSWSRELGGIYGIPKTTESGINYEILLVDDYATLFLIGGQLVPEKDYIELGAGSQNAPKTNHEKIWKEIVELFDKTIDVHKPYTYSAKALYAWLKENYTAPEKFSK